MVGSFRYDFVFIFWEFAVSYEWDSHYPRVLKNNYNTEHSNNFHIDVIKKYLETWRSAY